MSAVSAAGVAVVTAAMVVVLSVMNGFGTLVEKMFSQFDPDLKITPAEGKYFCTDTDEMNAVRSLPFVSVYSETIEEAGLIEYSERQVPAMLKGVDENFSELTQIDSIITDGRFSVTDWYDDGTGVPQRAFERSVLGIGLANQIGIGAKFVGGIKVYAPKRVGRISTLRPDRSLNKASTFISGIFAVNQTKYDDKYMLVSLPLARQLFEYGEHDATAVELRLTPDIKVEKAKRQIQSLLGDAYLVKDRYEQQADFFRIMQVEKGITVILMIFILLIASFNITGSLSMLMIDKREDIVILSHLGADRSMLQRIFLYEGWLISLIGAVAGLLLGITLSLCQEYFGWIKLGSGTEYIISSYPVHVQWLDILLVGLSVTVLGWLAAYIPSKRVEV